MTRQLTFSVALAVCSTALLCGSGAEPAIVATPLAKPSGPRGKTLFRALPAEQTDIAVQNNYDDPRMWGERSRGFFYGPLGTGVAIGDYDADGRPDILVVSKVEGHRLFRNLGDWRFQDVTGQARVASPADREWEQGATWVDVDNDGRLDLYICRSGAANLLYINQGDGTFREEAAARGLAVKDDSVMASFCDYDRDGWLDVYLVTNTLDVNQDPGRPDFLFHNNGDGTFSDVTAKAGIGSHPYQGHAAAWWDYNNDGWPDLYVANDFSPPDILYRNERDGSFSPEGTRAFPHTTNSSMGADTGDLNNDGRIDLFATDMAPTTHEKEQRTMADARAKLNDAFADPLAVIQLPRNALFLNTGSDFLQEAAELAGVARTDWTWSVRCEDLDCDGRLDLHFTNGMNREQNNVDLTRRIAAAESLREQTQLMKSSPVLAESNLAYRNLGDLQFQEMSAAWGLDEKGVSFGAALGDLDGDGDLDLVYTNYQAGVTVLRNDTAGGHRIMLHLRGRSSNRFGIGATVRIETANGTQVRQLALARGYMSSSEPAVHFGLGDATVITRATIDWPSGHKQILDNLAAGQSYIIREPEGAPVKPRTTPPPKDIQFKEVSPYAGLSHTVREARVDESRIQPLLPRTFNHAGPAIAVGDLDGDGTDDICLGGTTEDAPRVLIADRQGGYRESNALAEFANKTVNDGPILIFDANGDDQNDILITAGGIAAPAGNIAYQPRLLLNRGAAKFAPAAAMPVLPHPTGAAAAADFDRDGKLDVFLGARVLPGQYPDAPRSALLRNRDGAFEDVTETLAPGLRHAGNVTSALWSDVDADGWIDLLVAVEWGPVKYFRNAEGRFFEDRTESAGFSRAGNGLWTSLASADFNGDGQPDYAVGNIGLNTPYQAADNAPLVLLRGQFAEPGRPLTIEGYHDKERRLLPRAPRGEMGAAIPLVLRRYPTNNAYARATLPEIIGADSLATASRLTVTQLSSGVFLSQPDDTYVFTPLPRVAQIAPLQGMAAGDFDGDGHADIVAVQNAYTFSQTVGRFDGGLGQFLKGDGHGGFAAIEPADSGLQVPGDARALAMVNFDADAWPDFFVSRNRSVSLAWQNRGVSGHQTLEIRLMGAKGNRSAIGARVHVELADGNTQTSDVTAGGGVLSQGTTQLYFGYPADNPPRKIYVSWPSGRVSAAELAEVPARVELTEPAR